MKRRGIITAQRGNYENCLLPKIGITLVKDELVDNPIDIIEPRTGRYGDGKILVVPIVKSIGIRTGD